MTTSFHHAEMPQLPFAGWQSFLDFTQALGLAQLAKQYRHELVPTMESTRMTLAVTSSHSGLKHRRRHLV